MRYLSDSKSATIESFDDGLRGVGPALPFAREEDEFLHAAGFQIAQRGAGDLAQIAGGEFLGLPCADQQQALRVQALGEMDEHHFQRLAGEFPAGDQGGEPAVHGLVDVGQDAIEFYFPVKDIGDKSVGLNRRVRLVSN